VEVNKYVHSETIVKLKVKNYECLLRVQYFLFFFQYQRVSEIRTLKAREIIDTVLCAAVGTADLV